jgi:hypothetical protein
MVDLFAVSSVLGIAVAVSLLAFSTWPVQVEHLLASWVVTGASYLLLSLFPVGWWWHVLGAYAAGTGYYLWAAAFAQ